MNSSHATRSKQLLDHLQHKNNNCIFLPRFRYKFQNPCFYHKAESREVTLYKARINEKFEIGKLLIFCYCTSSPTHGQIAWTWFFRLSKTGLFWHLNNFLIKVSLFIIRVLFLLWFTNFEKTFFFNFIYSEKATKFCEIFPLLLTVCTVVKSKGKIYKFIKSQQKQLAVSK